MTPRVEPGGEQDDGALHHHDGEVRQVQQVQAVVDDREKQRTEGDARRGYTLEVRVSNAAAIALYEQLGFEAKGVRRAYYTDNREDALIMWRDPVRKAAAGE